MALARCGKNYSGLREDYSGQNPRVRTVPGYQVVDVPGIAISVYPRGRNDGRAGVTCIGVCLYRGRRGHLAQFLRFTTTRFKNGRGQREILAVVLLFGKYVHKIGISVRVNWSGTDAPSHKYIHKG